MNTDFESFRKTHWQISPATPECTAPTLGSDCNDRQEANPCPSCAEWNRILNLWGDGAKHRETREAALHLLRCMAAEMGVSLKPETWAKADTFQLLQWARDGIQSMLWIEDESPTD